MKRFLLLLLATMTMAVGIANDPEVETVLPSYDTEIVRRCFLMDIEGTVYHDVEVNLESKSPEFGNSKYRVNILVKTQNGKKVYKKTFQDCYLYIFSNGYVQVGKRNFFKLFIGKHVAVGAIGIHEVDGWLGTIREKEGIWFD